MNALARQFPQYDFALLAVVLALPLIGAFVNGVFGKRLGKDGVRMMALSAVGISFIASVITFLMVPRHVPATVAGGGVAPLQNAPKLVWNAWHWLDISGRGGRSIPIDVTFSADAMTATMMLVITGVGFLIHLYSSEYMKKDPGYYRYFSYLNLFIFSMLVLVMGDSMPVMFVGWEGVGLCSYLLIGFWFSEEKNAAAGKKAFIANRIGDFGLLCAMAMLVYYCGTLTFDGIKANAGLTLLSDVKIWPLGNLPIEADWDALHARDSNLPSWLVHLFLPKEAVTVKAATLVGWSVFLGCAGKSAQIPLYVWLPDAMAGPTPVSALIHAATMVTAGVYLVARMSDVFVLSPAAMATVAITGALTAIFAASMGLFQRDLKKVLAYSTVSQLGFMFIAVGVGAFSAGFFHVFTHAFFKACLFLGAGSVIHAMHVRIHDTDKSQDMFNMGGLKKYMPITHATYLVSCLSIAGLPFISAGFYSKDEILWKAYSTQTTGAVAISTLGKTLWQAPAWLGQSLYWVGIAGATMTSFYMFRSYFLTFHGDFRGWKIVRGWVDPHPHHAEDEHVAVPAAKLPKHAATAAAAKVAHDEEDEHEHEHEHDHHEQPGVATMDGPEPHESPWPMTVPLVILGAMAIFAGLLGAEPLHLAPLLHKLEPIFHNAQRMIGLRSGVEAHGAQMWMMMVPGALAFVVGSGAAYHIYLSKRGEPELAFKTEWPRLHGLLYNKWYIDELYEATVIGMVDALADIFVMADKWIIDGIIARLTALVVQGTGALLRLFHTGRVQIYAASMVIGLVGMGYFFVQPHATVMVDDAELKSSGKVVAQASPGLGYSYKWSGEGVPDADFSSAQNRLQFVVEQGKTKEVVVTVRNVFGRETQAKVTVTRETPARPGAPTRPGSGPPGVPNMAPGGRQQPAPPPKAPPPVKQLDGDQIPGLIRGEGN